MRRVRAVAALSLVLGCSPVLPVRPAAASAAGAPAVYAAEAEAWAYSVEVGIPGPLGPLASHTTAAVDNSPHATGAAGLADPGYLVRAAAGLVAGVPTPAYCESAWPEGPDHADCGASAVGHAAAQSRTEAGDGPDATATAALGRVSPSDAVGALTIDSQSTTSTALLDEDGSVRARADAVLHGVSVAGGALRLGIVAVHREAVASGTATPTTSASIALSGVTVAGTPVDPGADPVKSLADAVRSAFGDALVVESLGGREEVGGGKLAADSSGLRIRLQPQLDRWVQIVLGYGRVLVYGASGETPAGGDEGDAPAVADAAAPLSVAGGQGAELALPAGPSAAVPFADGAAPAVPVRSPTRAAFASPSTAVRWVSPFLVLAQMTSGGQAGWFVLGLLPILAGAWLARRAGMGVIAPWATPRRSS